MRNAGLLLLTAIAALIFAAPAPVIAQLKTDTTKLTPRAIEIEARPIAKFTRSDKDTPEPPQNGKLVWRGGLALTSTSPYFGGWSGLQLDADGKRLIAVSDAGLWMTAKMSYDANGRPKAVTNARIGPLLALSGKPLRRFRDRDAEAIAIANGTLQKASAYIAFEQNDRIGVFDLTEKGLSAPRRYIEMPPEKTRMRLDGVEALTVLKGGPIKGALVGFTENALRGEKVRRGWIWIKGKPKPFTVNGLGDFSVTGAASLDDGSVLLLERRFRWLEGLRIRMRHLPAASIRPGSAASGEVLLEANLAHEIDNMEGMSVSRTAGGETVVTLISDDNYNRFLQRTLLLQFTLPTNASADAAQVSREQR